MLLSETTTPVAAENADFALPQTLEGAVAAYEAALANYRQKADEQDAAEEAERPHDTAYKAALEAARASIPAPAELIVGGGDEPFAKRCVVYWSDGTERVAFDQDTAPTAVLSNEHAIWEHVNRIAPKDARPDDIKAIAEPMIAALRRWNGEVAKAARKAAPEAARAIKAAQAASSATGAAEAMCTKARLAILDVPAPSIGIAMAKQRAYFETLNADVSADGTVKGRRNNRRVLYDLDGVRDQDQGAAHEALMRDIMRLDAEPKDGAAHNIAQVRTLWDRARTAQADQRLIAAVSELRAIVETLDNLPASEEHRRHELVGAEQAPVDRALATRATTLDGLLERVWLVEQYLPGEDMVEHDDLEFKVIRSLLEDIRALSTVTQPAQQVAA